MSILKDNRPEDKGGERDRQPWDNEKGRHGTMGKGDRGQQERQTRDDGKGRQGMMGKADKG